MGRDLELEPGHRREARRVAITLLVLKEAKGRKVAPTIMPTTTTTTPTKVEVEVVKVVVVAALLPPHVVVGEEEEEEVVEEAVEVPLQLTTAVVGEVGEVDMAVVVVVVEIVEQPSPCMRKPIGVALKDHLLGLVAVAVAVAIKVVVAVVEVAEVTGVIKATEVVVDLSVVWEVVGVEEAVVDVVDVEEVDMRMEARSCRVTVEAVEEAGEVATSSSKSIWVISHLCRALLYTRVIFTSKFETDMSLSTILHAAKRKEDAHREEMDARVKYDFPP